MKEGNLMTEKQTDTTDGKTGISREEMYRRSMIRAHIKAYIQRGIRAGIPKRYLRIGKEEFKTFLSETYHNDKEKIASFIYDTPLELSKVPYIVIDGGNIEVRKKAAWAIMFRLITCDNFAKYYDCRDLVHKLNAFDPRDVRSGEGRNGIAEYLKKVNVFHLSEFRSSVFSEHCEAGAFLDEIIDSRVNELNPTIITFQEPLSPNKAIKNVTCGQYINELSHKEYCDEKNKSLNPSRDLLRIRVRVP
jgi:hypothetical protein